MDNERFWVAAARSGDRAAYDRLCLVYRSEICAFCIRFLGQRDDAEDAAQDVFSRAWDRLLTFRNDSTFRTWLWEIARNVCLNRLRARQSSLNRRMQSLEAMPGTERTETLEVPDSRATPEETIIRSAQLDHIRTEIARHASERRWSSNDWELFIFRIEQAMTYGEFARLRGHDEAYWRNRWRDRVKPVLEAVRRAIEP